MARNRGGSRKARGKSKANSRTPRPQKNLQKGDLEEHSRIVLPQFSLLDVARNTERHKGGDHRNRKDLGLQFVHGGMLEGSLEQQDFPTSDLRGPNTSSTRPEPIVERSISQLDHAGKSSGMQIDKVQIDKAIEQASDSEDEVIVFQGRGASQQHDRKELQPNNGDRRLPSAHHHRPQNPMGTGKTRGKRTFSLEPISEPKVAEPEASQDEEAIDDYIANILANGSGTEDGTPETEEEPGDIDHRGRSGLISPQTLPSSTALAEGFLALRSLARDFEDEPESDSSESEDDTTASVGTVDQATRDLQVAFDDFEKYEIGSIHTTAISRRKGRNTHPRYYTESTATKAVSLAIGEGTQGFVPGNNTKENPESGDSSDFLDSRRSKKRQSEKTSNASFIAGPKWGERNEFDVTDRSRKSIADDNRTAYSYVDDLELSDSELERTLLESWKKDKAKKRHRKKEREEARARGLLGVRRNESSTSADLLQELGWDALTAQIKRFILSNDESLTLTPMGKRSRRVVHEFANALNLKSKSIGSGERRFPTLTRTPRTVHVTGALFEDLDARLARRFTTGTKRQFRDTPTGKDPRYGKSSFAAASYRDGEIVGATAPEIGLDNRGRAMLEKMGWSSGTALGAANNKGILLPVAHTVKNSKLGLG